MYWQQLRYFGAIVIVKVIEMVIVKGTVMASAMSRMTVIVTMSIQIRMLRRITTNVVDKYKTQDY